MVVIFAHKVGRYVVDCETDAHGGLGQVVFGPRADARRFPDVDAATALWRGYPPLTAYSLQVVGENEVPTVWTTDCPQCGMGYIGPCVHGVRIADEDKVDEEETTSSELPKPLPTIDWHFIEDGQEFNIGHGYRLSHEHTGSHLIAGIKDFKWTWQEGTPAPVYLLTGPPEGQPKLTQAEWTVVVAEVVAAICSILHEPFYPRRTENGRHELDRKFGRVTALGGF